MGVPTLDQSSVWTTDDNDWGIAQIVPAGEYDDIEMYHAVVIADKELLWTKRWGLEIRAVHILIKRKVPATISWSKEPFRGVMPWWHVENSEQYTDDEIAEIQDRQFAEKGWEI